MSRTHLERPLQQYICAHLAADGWKHSPNSNGYDAQRALFPADVLAWLQTSDPKSYASLIKPEADPATRQAQTNRLLDRLVTKLSDPEEHGGGTLNVLRKGFSVPGARRPFHLIAYPPQDGRNPELTALYQQNILRVVEEVRFNPADESERIDLVLFINGLPVATIELKSEYTQTLQHAINQYRNNRNPKTSPLLQEHRGALVHFALTQDEIAMTTKLAGKATTFLPFNQGKDGGAGNPIVDGKLSTSYFWEEILEPNTWINILTKFIYTNHQKTTDPLTGKTKQKSHIRFPRYHQWRAVTKLVNTARIEGAGKKYLVQHSAGSGKTDSIAWTAHRLSNLHTPKGERVFDSVIVIADRQVLDQQLQDAIDQLVTTAGTFQPITRGTGDSKSKQLVDALITGVPIIGVTLQTFPFALEEMTREGGKLAGKHFAIIADEAHSSQSGKATDSIKTMLTTDVDAGIEESDPEADQEALTRMAQRVVGAGHQVSFFAFTATPKAKTLEIFGRRPADGGPHEPFDLYPMKQAIEEGFILDVLKNYTTYEMAAKIAQTNADSGVDEEIDIRKGTKSLINFVELHPTNVASKVAVILEHFEGKVKHELGGKAKAMVVTSSRASAVRYQRAFEKAIAERGLPLKTLVAFSGELPDPDIEPVPGVDTPTVTEASMNPDLKGRNLAEVFNQDGQHILIVANKYQTGFDQPLLVAMYVDKKLSGITAVQTLSRLNRRAEGKDNTYILDFVNDPEQIRASFAEYYEDAHIETESDLDLVAKQVDKLDAVSIYNRADVEQFWEKWVAQGARQASYDSLIRVPVERFVTRWDAARSDDDKAALEVLLEFRSTLAQYVKSYAFFSQIFNFGDPYYEKLSSFADLLARKLRRFTLDEVSPEVVNVDDIVLTHYRLEKLREDEDLKLSTSEAAGLQGMTEAGLASIQERERKARSILIEKVNKYFHGLELSDEHQVGFATTFVAEAAKDAGLKQSAMANAKVDFYHSKNVRNGLANKLWDYSSDTADLIDYVRRMPAEKFVEFMMDMGLYELLRGEKELVDAAG
ncbi:type I restriction endonuclease subunit R [Rothia terrae]|uniref:type I restriction endonuclease subunit R n=1 Tax=Rothia terrae TaxID=396015 RepID=UPI0014454173|nr:type I restriction endonuclease [Rothia terrae]MDT0190182.1 type I restriction endonuclease [Rothia terrae]NKZ35194.1 type I restriction endonuclease subunit R [Rothia terrae]